MRGKRHWLRTVTFYSGVRVFATGDRVVSTCGGSAVEDGRRVCRWKWAIYEVIDTPRGLRWRLVEWLGVFPNPEAECNAIRATGLDECCGITNGSRVPTAEQAMLEGLRLAGMERPFPTDKHWFPFGKEDWR